MFPVSSSMSGNASLPSTNMMSGWAAPADGVGVGVGSVWALALRTSASRARAMRDARAIRARAAVGLGNLGNEEGVRRDESRRRREGATGLLPRMDEGQTWVSLLEHTTGGGILDFGAE